MPELPDVAGFRRYLEQTALRQRIARVELHDADRVLKQISAAAMRERLAGCQLTGTRRHGKFLFASTDNSQWLVMHFGMSGELQYDHENASLPSHARLVLRFEGGGWLAYQNQRKLGQLTLTEHVLDFIAEHVPGRDPLDEGFTREHFHDLLASRRGMVKSALMNQKLIAGIGNVYTDEILFQAGLRPDVRAASLEQTQIARIYEAMREVMSTAASVDGDISRLPGHYLLPHRNEGESCPRCYGTLATMKTAGRTSYYCPACQP